MKNGENSSSGETPPQARYRNILIFSALLLVVGGFTVFEVVFFDLHSYFVHASILFSILLVILLVLLISRNLIKLYRYRKARLIGSSIQVRTTAAFIILTIIPATLLFLLASNMILSVIDRWFNPEVEEYIRTAKEVTGIHTDFLRDLALGTAGRIADSLARDDGGAISRSDLIKQKLDNEAQSLKIDYLEVFGPDRSSIYRRVVSDDKINPLFEPSEEAFILGRADIYYDFESMKRGKIVYALKAIRTKDIGDLSGFVSAGYYLSADTTRKIDSLFADFKRYKQQNVFRRPTKTLYIMFFLLITLVLVFSSIWVGVHVARGITEPIKSLARGTQAIASGDLDFVISAESEDDIGVLVKSFNKMTKDLKANKRLVEHTTQKLKEANRYLDEHNTFMQTILENITTGVITIDRDSVITTYNPAAEDILHVPVENAIGKNYEEAFSEDFLANFCGAVRHALGFQRRHHISTLDIHASVSSLVVEVNMAPMFDENELYLGMVLVLEDLTQLVKAQRAFAWREVARRIAHEVKNPLTPISLAAQRLRRKSVQDPVFPELLDDCTETIIRETEVLKNLINEFSRFARMPKAQLKPDNLNEVIREAAALYSGVRGVEIEVEPDETLPALLIDREQMKRVFINLIDNAVTAMDGSGRIVIRTRNDGEYQVARAEVADNGPGIRDENRRKLFVPYFSTKGEIGSGLGLSIVNRIIADHNGYIRVESNKPKGSVFILEIPINPTRFDSGSS